MKGHQGQDLGKVLVKVERSAPPARLLMGDAHAYLVMNLTGCEGGYPASAPGVGSNVPLVAVDFG